MTETFTDDPLLTPRFDAALLYASEHHRSQLRKRTDIPYLAHLLAVTALVLEAGGGEDEAIAALLHDVVEDGGGAPALAYIDETFGADVARWVEQSSDNITPPKPPWRERKQGYLDAMAEKDPGALLVGLADKVHNARSILADYQLVGEDVWSRFSAGDGDEVRWYYRALVDAFTAQRDRLPPRALPLLEQLRLTVDEIDRLAAAPQSVR
jgi:(p)ppGpp synthase/HD superfamily hydrolase